MMDQTSASPAHWPRASCPGGLFRAALPQASRVLLCGPPRAETLTLPMVCAVLGRVAHIDDPVSRAAGSDPESKAGRLSSKTMMSCLPCGSLMLSIVARVSFMVAFLESIGKIIPALLSESGDYRKQQKVPIPLGFLISPECYRHLLDQMISVRGTAFENKRSKKLPSKISPSKDCANCRGDVYHYRG